MEEVVGVQGNEPAVVLDDMHAGAFDVAEAEGEPIEEADDGHPEDLVVGEVRASSSWVRLPPFGTLALLAWQPNPSRTTLTSSMTRPVGKLYDEEKFGWG